jgi:hypothetical protein
VHRSCAAALSATTTETAAFSLPALPVYLRDIVGNNLDRRLIRLSGRALLSRPLLSTPCMAGSSRQL